MNWILALLVLALCAALAYGVFYAIVVWALSDSPPGSSFCGITNKKGPDE